MACCVYQEMSDLAEGWNSEILDIRLVWLSSAFYVVGGGPVVANSLFYALLADVVPESSR